MDFWGDAWIPSLPGFKIFSTKSPSSTIEKVSDAIDTRRGTWDKQKLAGEVSQEELEAILNIPLPVRDREDQLEDQCTKDNLNMPHSPSMTVQLLLSFPGQT
ncbi:hypothetical protein RHGRI_034195 [Rhododendron griersonianum]|uniref:Uncharacterized protein n=1 Tax=Rhododendron griersonianum TaxID=479676 RepID=A0AAV6I580_9ERIC|nr:hypothetical protein RHGRI_034195 [Rhododendron griersonianum]